MSKEEYCGCLTAGGRMLQDFMQILGTGLQYNEGPWFVFCELCVGVCRGCCRKVTNQRTRVVSRAHSREWDCELNHNEVERGNT